VTKKHRVAVIRALRRIGLPDGWHVSGKHAYEDCLYNQHSVESTLKARWLWSQGHLTFEAFKRITTVTKDVTAKVETEKRHRDACAKKTGTLANTTKTPSDSRDGMFFKDAMEGGTVEGIVAAVNDAKIDGMFARGLSKAERKMAANEFRKLLEAATNLDELRVRVGLGIEDFRRLVRFCKGRTAKEITAEIFPKGASRRDYDYVCRRLNGALAIVSEHLGASGG
jgi:hypothetical protein